MTVPRHEEDSDLPVALHPARLPTFHVGPSPRHLHRGRGSLPCGTGLVADPASVGEHDAEENDDQIEPEHGKPRDNHAAMLGLVAGVGHHP
jgi:hypothetical protein